MTAKSVAVFLEVLSHEVMNQDGGGRRVDLNRRCFIVVHRRSGRGAVACVGANHSPAEEPTPELEMLVGVLWPEGFPGDRLFIDGGVELIQALSGRLAELIRIQQARRRCPRRSRGSRVEALLFA